MTLDEFFDCLAISPYKFKLHCGGIRVDGPHCYCPINAVAKQLGGNRHDYTSMPETSADFLGLADEDIDEIVNASDSYRARLRERMLRAVKLAPATEVCAAGSVAESAETPSLNV